MLTRLPPLDLRHGFFLFGARGTGKTSLLRQRFGLVSSAVTAYVVKNGEGVVLKKAALSADTVASVIDGPAVGGAAVSTPAADRPAADRPAAGRPAAGRPSTKTLWIDLLDFKTESYFSENPDLLSYMLDDAPYARVVIDEVQKIPKLLDIVHKQRELKKHIQFILTGSSARKLKRGAANLLAGRLFYFHLYPLTHIELADQFKLDDVLRLGSLPGLQEYGDDIGRLRYLEAYAQTYLKEEVFAEQLVRKLKPFKNFIHVAAQHSGGRLNFSKVASRLGLDHSTVKNYFEILCDTHLAFYLPSFSRSFRKQQVQSPKFYLFDLGVLRMLMGHAMSPVQPHTYEYGRLFEHFVVLEALRLNHYYEARCEFSYFLDRGGNEIDLIIQSPRSYEAEACEVEPREADPCEADPCEVDPHEADPCEADPCEADPCEADPCEADPCEADPCEASKKAATLRDDKKHEDEKYKAERYNTSQDEILVEIKSTTKSTPKDAKVLKKMLKLWDRPARAQVWSQDPFNRRVDDIEYLHWQEGLRRLFKK